MKNETDYSKYRGKCKEMSEKLIKTNPNLTLARGWYHCPIWGKQQHWWCKDQNGNIIDPTSKQFPSKGIGEYEEYQGYIECEYCGKSIQETDIKLNGHHVYCSTFCMMKDVGL